MTKPKFEITEKCIDCNSPLQVTSIIPENIQINFQCSNAECDKSGFIYQGKILFNYNERFMQEG
jgi:hypothetical protein